MDALVLGLLEVEVVADEMVTALVDGVQHQVHVELAPALFLQQEGRLLEGCTPAPISLQRDRHQKGETEKERDGE